MSIMEASLKLGIYKNMYPLPSRGKTRSEILAV